MVLFGERLLAGAELVARRAVRDCDLFVAVGTSTAVSTARFFLDYAAEAGAVTVCVDPAPEVHDHFTLHVPEPAEVALDKLVGHRFSDHQIPLFGLRGGPVFSLAGGSSPSLSDEPSGVGPAPGRERGNGSWPWPSVTL